MSEERVGEWGDIGRLPDGTAPSAKTPDGVTAPVADAVSVDRVDCWMVGRGCNDAAVYRFHHSFFGIGSTCVAHTRQLEVGQCDLIVIGGKP